MFRSSTAKRVRGIVVALLLTFAMNYAISYAARPNSATKATESQISISTSSERSGNGNRPTVLPPQRSGNGNRPTVLPPQ